MNKSPHGEKSIFAKLEAGDRKSDHTSPMEVMNYNLLKGGMIEALQAIPKLPDDRTTLILKKDLKDYVESEGHNTSALLQAVGIVREVDRHRVIMTSLGLRLKEHPEQWELAIKNQILLYKNSHEVNPYRKLVELLIKFDKLSYHEFLFGPNYAIMRGGMFPDEEVERRINYLRENWPNGLFNIPQTAYEEVVAEINDALHTDYGELEVFIDRGTHANKFRYLKNVLGLLPYIDAPRDYKKPITLTNIPEALLDLHFSTNALNLEYGSAGAWWVGEVGEA